MNFKLWIALLLALLLVVFAAQNYQVAELRFLFWKLEMSRSILMLGVFLGGIAVGALGSGFRRAKHDA